MFLGILRKHKILLAFAILTIVLCISVNTFAAEGGSSFVTQSDGKSYNGLPDFPIYAKVNSSQHGTCYIHCNDYILKKSGDTYYLLAFCSDGNGNLYLESNNSFGYTGTLTYYNDTSFSSVAATYDLISVEIYQCSSDLSSWKYLESRSPGSTNIKTYGDNIIQSSCNIYTDSSCSEVFTKSATEPLISGMSSTTITEILKSQVLGLVPSLVALLICLVGFWMAWRILRKTLLAA